MPLFFKNVTLLYSDKDFYFGVDRFLISELFLKRKLHASIEGVSGLAYNDSTGFQNESPCVSFAIVPKGFQNKRLHRIIFFCITLNCLVLNQIMSNCTSLQ